MPANSRKTRTTNSDAQPGIEAERLDRAGVSCNDCRRSHSLASPASAPRGAGVVRRRISLYPLAHWWKCQQIVKNNLAIRLWLQRWLQCKQKAPLGVLVVWKPKWRRQAIWLKPMVLMDILRGDAFLSDLT